MVIGKTIELKPSPINGYYCPNDPGEPGSMGMRRLSVNDREEGKLLASLAQGKTVIEIGTGLGVSTRLMAETAKFIYTFDIDSWVVINIFPRLKLEFDNIVCNPSKPLQVDMAFIDGLHTYRQCCEDIELCKRRVKPGGLIVFHDANIYAVLKAVIDSHLPSVYVQTRAGMAIAWNYEEIK